MSKKRTLDPQMIDSVAQNMFHALPLIKKRLLHMDMIQREHGTPLSHVQVLAMLQDAGTMSVSEISRRLGIAKPNITPLVDRLYEAGYVDRQHDENDRRVVNIVLLPAGSQKLTAIRATISRQIQTQAEGPFPFPSSVSCMMLWKASFASSPPCNSSDRFGGLFYL